MDHRRLLRRYIEHVAICEGTDFLGENSRSIYSDSINFSDEEWAELQKIVREPFPASPPEDEPEIDYNTVVYAVGSDGIFHTFDPKCPPGCNGHLEGCVHNQKE